MKFLIKMPILIWLLGFTLSCGILSVKSSKNEFHEDTKVTNKASYQILLVLSYDFKYGTHVSDARKNWSDHPSTDKYAKDLTDVIRRKSIDVVKEFLRQDQVVTLDPQKIDKNKKFITLNVTFKEFLNYKEMNAAEVGLTFGAISKKQPLQWEVIVKNGEKKSIVEDIINTESRYACSTYFGCGAVEKSKDMIEQKSVIVMRMLKKAINEVL